MKEGCAAKDFFLGRLFVGVGSGGVARTTTESKIKKGLNHATDGIWCFHRAAGNEFCW